LLLGFALLHVSLIIGACHSGARGTRTWNPAGAWIPGPALAGRPGMTVWGHHAGFS
jgi:hypothetical protein